jgi:hypothetical protein
MSILFNINAITFKKFCYENPTLSFHFFKAGRLTMELHPWYGSAAIVKVNEIQKRISKKEI